MDSSADIKPQLYYRKHFSSLCSNIMRCLAISLKKKKNSHASQYLSLSHSHLKSQSSQVNFHLFIYSSIHAFRRNLLSAYYILDSSLGTLDVAINRTKSRPSWSLHLEGGREMKTVIIDNKLTKTKYISEAVIRDFNKRAVLFRQS